ncbi:HAD family hydrolase [Aneurinibacillus uraniidurans]|uniref:HAD family hydrolase n=1 Tax=Aneurinibacillus uraniidurans TaxID=2966586 RepID=UPI00234AE2C4|nr:HAD family hydrolase [Aneurinibacillus sp. B1]WCN37318.1 HAD family hydrolase [Aneurinibacillus sp. B1]
MTEPRAILFDLDGTLLTMDTEAFVKRYIERLGAYTAHIIEPQKLGASLWEATKHVMQDDDGTKTNAEVFQQKFLDLTGLAYDTVWPVFDQFYADEFPVLQEDCGPHPYAAKVVEEAKRQGYHVVVATNPVFPGVSIIERLRWAGFAAEDFVHVTVFEEAHYCKPNPNYFREISESIGIPPERCIMIGNDMQQDMVAEEVGMQTFLVEDYKIDRGVPQHRVTASGMMKQLYDMLVSQQGPFIKKSE